MSERKDIVCILGQTCCWRRVFGAARCPGDLVGQIRL